MLSSTTKKTKKKKPFKIAGVSVAPGERKKIDIEVASLYDYTQLNIPIEVIRGKSSGPVLFVSAAIHGDEINGVEIIKRLLQKKRLEKLKGTLIAVPVVNIFGFNHKSRYLPDRRDLNRCFPGSKEGSLASRMAHIFMKEVVSKCTHGIDFHTGAIHRTNLSQIRACLDDAETADLAKGFGVPLLINSKLRDGSLRESAQRKKVKTLLFEGGEALRFEENVIKTGLKGTISVMEKIGMLAPLKGKKELKRKAYTAESSYWVRASHSGSFRLKKHLGDVVKPGDILGVITNLYGEDPYPVKAETNGIIIGMTKIPLVNKGEGMFHIADFDNTKHIKAAIDLMEEA